MVRLSCYSIFGLDSREVVVFAEIGKSVWDVPVCKWVVYVSTCVNLTVDVTSSALVFLPWIDVDDSLYEPDYWFTYLLNNENNHEYKMLINSAHLDK